MSKLKDDPTHFNAALDERVVIKPEDYQWIDSPMPGVERMRLDRISETVDRVTTVVRYEPNSEFSPHTHTGGEEFYVLEGVFSDEHASYPKGTYVRNPIGTSHTPRIGPEGATIFVKLQQFEADDSDQKAINSNATEWLPGLVDGLQVMPLHQHRHENVALVKWAPNTVFNSHHHWGGEEIFVIEGTFYDEHGTYPAGSWLRSPHLSQHRPFTKDEGALIYVKTGHLG